MSAVQANSSAWTEGFGLELAILAEKDFDAGFRVFELLAAGFAERYAFFEELHLAFEGEVAGFELADYFFQLFQAGFEGQDGLGVCWRLGHCLILARSTWAS